LLRGGYEIFKFRICSIEAKAWYQSSFGTVTYSPDLPLNPVCELPIKSLYTFTPIEEHSSKVPSLQPLALAYWGIGGSVGMMNRSWRMLEDEFPDVRSKPRLTVHQQKYKVKW
jgi:hypothetical protein